MEVKHTHTHTNTQTHKHTHIYLYAFYFNVDEFALKTMKQMKRWSMKVCMVLKIMSINKVILRAPKILVNPSAVIHSTKLYCELKEIFQRLIQFHDTFTLPWGTPSVPFKLRQTSREAGSFWFLDGSCGRMRFKFSDVLQRKKNKTKKKRKKIAFTVFARLEIHCLRDGEETAVS